MTFQTFKPSDNILVRSTVDALDFLREFNHVISYNALQVYTSALQFTPRSTTIWENFVDIPGTPVFVHSGFDQDWRSSQRLLKSTMKSRTCICFSPDGQFLAELGEIDRTIQIWEVNSRSMINSLNVGHKLLGLHTLVFTADSGTILIAGLCGVVAWNFQELSDPDVHAVPEDAQNASVAIATDGSCFVLGSLDQDIEVWEAKSRFKASVSVGRGSPLSVSRGGTSILFCCKETSSAQDETELIRCWHTDMRTSIVIPVPQLSKFYCGREEAEPVFPVISM
jgi:WD40 repeat protein